MQKRIMQRGLNCMTNELQNVKKEDEENLHNEHERKKNKGERRKEKNDLEERGYRKSKIKLEDLRKNKRKYSIIMGIFFAIILALFLLFWGINSPTISGFKIFCTVLGVILFCIFISLYMYLLLDIKESKLREEMLLYEAEDIKEEVQEDVFENSIKMSYKYLDQYYLQTREQAQKGFFVTVCVSVLGAVLLGVGIVAMFLEKTEPSYVTCASGVITEFIAAIFFYLYNKTVMSMSKYHNKLVLSQNISIALKVSDSLPDEDKTKSKNKIIEELLKDINSYLINSDSESSKNDMKEGNNLLA